MTNTAVSYIKTDDNIVLNEKHIKWIKKMDECLEVCIRSDGCSVLYGSKNTHTVCKLKNSVSYTKLARFFE